MFGLETREKDFTSAKVQVRGEHGGFETRMKGKVG